MGWLEQASAMTCGLALAAATGCASHAGTGLVRLQLRPGESILTATDVASGRRTECAADCELSVERGRRIDVALRSWTGGEPAARARLRIGESMRVRAEREHRSDLRTAGGVTFGVGLVLSLTLLGVGAGVAAELPSCSGFCIISPQTEAWLGFGGGAAVLLAVATGLGSALLSRGDRWVLRRERVAPTLEASADGAVLGARVAF